MLTGAGFSCRLVPISDTGLSALTVMVVFRTDHHFTSLTLPVHQALPLPVGGNWGKVNV